MEHLAGLGVQLAFAMTGPCVLPALRVLVPLGLAEGIRLGIQHRVERLFHGAADHLIQMVLNAGLIDGNDFLQVFADCVDSSFSFMLRPLFGCSGYRLQFPYRRNRKSAAHQAIRISTLSAIYSYRNNSTMDIRYTLYYYCGYFIVSFRKFRCLCLHMYKVFIRPDEIK